MKRSRLNKTDCTRFLMVLLLLFISSMRAAAEPKREAGLSVHMLPNRVAEISSQHGGFTVTDPATNQASVTYAQPKELVEYFIHLPASVQENGIWVVTTDPSSYSESEQTKLKTLAKFCAEKKIPIFICRASELPRGWKPLE